MDNSAEEKKPTALEAARQTFLHHYTLIQDNREHIFRQPALYSAPLEWYIPNERQLSGKGNTSLSLGQLLGILEKLEEKNEGKRIHESWLADEESWNEVLRFSLPEGKPEYYSGFSRGMWNEHKTPVQNLRDQVKMELQTIPLYLSMEEVVEELRSTAWGMEKKSEQVQAFHEGFRNRESWKEEGRRYRLFSKAGSRVSLRMQCPAHRLQISNDPGPVNTRWRTYDEARKALIKEIGSQFSVGIEEKTDKLNFYLTWTLDEILSRGAEATLGWVNEVFDTVERQIRELNARFRKSA